MQPTSPHSFVLLLCVHVFSNSASCVSLRAALRDNRIELVHASLSELTISISDVTLSDEGMYTCSLFTMPVRTAKAYLTVLGKCKIANINPRLKVIHVNLNINPTSS